MINIIGLTGAMGSGKSTLASLLAAKCGRPAHVLKFAEPLYDIQDYVYKRCGLNSNGTKDRRLLQVLGTEWGRELHVDLWTTLWGNKATEILRANPDTLIICDDVRFDNEAETVNALGGRVVEVFSPLQVRRQRGNVTYANHSSEHGVLGDYVDYVVDNYGSLYELENLAKHLLEVFDA